MSQLIEDIHAQPTALRRLAADIGTHDGWRALAALGHARPPLLLGMGASYHAALVAERQLWHYGIAAQALEAADLVLYGQLQPQQPVIFVSQSGESAEVAPLLARLPADTPLIAVTNTPDSTLARHAQIVLPVQAGPGEMLVATRTYVNSLAALWLLGRIWGGAQDGSEQDALERTAAAMDALLAEAKPITTQWLDTLEAARTLVFLGHGPHAATARHAAMMMTEWVKQPTLGTSIGAFRHGVIEIVQPDVGVVIFTAPSAGHRSALALADELVGYGAQVLLVNGGTTGTVAEPPASSLALDEFLAPLLAVVPAQLFVDALQKHRGGPAQFRYISKVTTRL